MPKHREGDWVEPFSTPRLGNFTVAPPPDARGNLATETSRLRSAGPARSPPPYSRPTRLRSRLPVSMATAPDALGQPLVRAGR